MIENKEDLVDKYNLREFTTIKVKATPLVSSNDINGINIEKRRITLTQTKENKEMVKETFDETFDEGTKESSHQFGKIINALIGCQENKNSRKFSTEKVAEIVQTIRSELSYEIQNDYIKEDIKNVENALTAFNKMLNDMGYSTLKEFEKSVKKRVGGIAKSKENTTEQTGPKQG